MSVCCGPRAALQSAVFGEQLLLRRRIQASLGDFCFTVRDQVKNACHTRTSHVPVPLQCRVPRCR